MKIAYIVRFDKEGKWFLSSPMGYAVSRFDMARTSRVMLEYIDVEGD